MTKRYDSLIGIPWYRPERFADARRQMADFALIPETYDLWLKGAEKREHEARSSGATPHRVYVDDDRFLAFCRDKGLLLDSKARTRYAADFCASTFKANIADYANPGFQPVPIPKKKRKK